MRRVLLVLAVVFAGAVSKASGQQRVQLQASVDSSRLTIHLANLFDDAQWRGALNDEVVVRLHWTAQLWRRRSTIGADQGPKGSWDVFVRHVPVTDLYAVTTVIAGTTPAEERPPTADSLQALVGRWFSIDALKPTGPGQWYYTVDLVISGMSQAEFAKTQLGEGGGTNGNALERLLLGSGMPSVPLHQQTATFTVPPRR